MAQAVIPRPHGLTHVPNFIKNWWDQAHFFIFLIDFTWNDLIVNQHKGVGMSTLKMPPQFDFSI